MNPRQPPLNSLRARLVIGAGIPLVLFIGVTLIALSVLYRLLDALTLERHSHQVVVQALKQQDQLHRMGLAVLYGSGTDPDLLKSNYEASRLAFLDANKAARDLVRDDADQVNSLARMRDLEAEWHAAVADGLKGPQHAPPGFLARSQTLEGRIQTELDKFIDAEEGRLAGRRQEAERQAWQSGWTIYIALVVAAAVSLVSAWAVSLGVTGPVDRLRKAAGQLLAGRFEVERPRGPNEIAQLIVDFNQIGLALAQHVTSLRQEEEGYRQYIGAVSQLTWRTHPSGEVLTDLPSWQVYTGQTGEQVRGSGWLDAVHPEDRPAVLEKWREAVLKRSIFEAECRLRSSAGDHRCFACRGVPILNPDGSVREWIGTCADVTERKERERLRQEKEAAEAASRAKSEFLARMSHELRTPLNAIIGMSRMLSTQRFGVLNAKQADYLNDVTQAGEHLLALINDILDIAKVEAGRMDLRAEGFAPGEVVRSVLSTLRPLAGPKGLTMRFDPPEGEGELAADPARFKQVLYNLLSNAIKFTPPKGTVMIRCQWTAGVARGAPPTAEPEAPALRVEVTDTGAGIAAVDQEHIWDEFRQLPMRAGPGGGPQGTGLGLAVSRQLVQRMGGVIWVESAPGSGSTFGFVLPRRPPAGQPAAADGTAESPRPLALVVEDYPPTHKLLVDWLTEAGLATASATDGEAALAQARRLHPRLIVLDLQLPKRDGWQVLTDLKNDPATADIPVAVVTVGEDRMRPVGLDVQEFFIKPLHREDFFRRLRAVQPGLFDGGRAIKVLVVDDDPAARRWIGGLLSGEGVQVTEAASGREALEALRSDLPDLVVLDLLMPEMDGFTTVEAIRDEPAWDRLPILVTTAKDLTEEERQRLTGRTQALVTKHRLTPERFREQLRGLGLLRAAE